MTAALRIIAVAIAVAAAVDPSISASRIRPIALELQVGSGGQASAVRDRVLAELGDTVTPAPEGQGDAVVVIGAEVKASDIRDDVTVSAVLMNAAPNLRLVSAHIGSVCLPGQEASVEVEADVVGLTGRKSLLIVTRNGVEIGRTEHVWAGITRQRVSVPVVTMGAGAHAIKIAAAPFEDETRQDDNTVDAKLVTLDRPLRVAFVEPRPSWAAGFVRRLLESDASFEVASVVRPSRGIEVRTSGPLSGPSAASAAILSRFDVVVAGAPEELRVPELETLRVFMTERGGIVWFLPDRRPFGPYATFITPAGFDEALLEAAIALETPGTGRAPRASEFAIPRTPSPAMRTLASLPDGRPVIASWPVGDGALMFSGALDAWRFRGADGGRFASFWRAAIAESALAAPPAVQIDLYPPVVRPGAEVQIIARVRRTEFERSPDGTVRLPLVRAVAVHSEGSATATEPIRLWPALAPGVFEGRFTPADSGTSSVHVMAGRAEATDVVIQAGDGASVQGDDEEARLVASATGGVVGTPDDIAPIVNHVRSLVRSRVPETRHPMRHGWWTLPFALALCAEWTLRRRRGRGS